jgi:hypothetical protein
MLAKPRPQPDVIAVHLAAAAEINLSCQPLTDRPTAELFNLRSNSPLQRPMQLADSTYLPKHSMPIYSKLVPCSPWLNQFHRRHTTFRYLPAMFNKIANHIRRRSPWQITPIDIDAIEDPPAATGQHTLFRPQIPRRLPPANHRASQISITAFATLAPLSPRGFVPGRLPDAGRCPRGYLISAGVRNPSPLRTSHRSFVTANAFDEGWPVRSCIIIEFRIARGIIEPWAGEII